MNTGFNLKARKDGRITAQYRLNLPEGYIEPKNFPFCIKNYGAIYNYIWDNLGSCNICHQKQKSKIRFVSDTSFYSIIFIGISNGFR